MQRSSRTSRTLAATAVAAGVLTSALALAGPPATALPPGQDPAKVEVKAVVVEILKPAEPAAAPKAKVKAATAPTAPPPQAIVIGADAEAMKIQYIAQLRPILAAELRLLSMTCAVSPADRREIAIEGGRALKAAAAKAAELRFGLNPGRRVDPLSEPQKRIESAMEAAAMARLSHEQFGRYKAELEGRAGDRKEVAVLLVVANLDRALHLSADQREKLGASLRSLPDSASLPPLEKLVVYDAYFPMLSDGPIVPLLNEEQVKVWRGVQKIDMNSILNFNLLNNALMNGDVDEDPDVKAALDEEAKK